MVKLVRDFKAKHPDAIIMQNRGLGIMGDKVFVDGATEKQMPSGLGLTQATENNPDVILYENAFVGGNRWEQQIIDDLEKVQQSGNVDVVAMGFQDSLRNKKKFLKRCQEYNFVPSWASNSQSLHLEIAK
jgi:hypothetical protein